MEIYGFVFNVSDDSYYSSQSPSEISGATIPSLDHGHQGGPEKESTSQRAGLLLSKG